MEAHNVNGPRPARAIAACVALGLALAAVMVVLYPALRANQGLAGDRDYEAILGSAPSPGAGARILQTDARAMDSGTRSATANAVQPGDPAAYPVEAEAKPLETPAPTATGTSDAAVQDTSSSLQSDADLSTFDGARAATDLKPSLPEDKGDPVATVSGWFSEPAKDRGISPLTTATITPSDDGKLCEWTYELIDAKDANRDGHPEYVHVRGMCVYEKDDHPADGNPEISVKMARDFEAWDNDSNGQFNVLIGKQGLVAFADPNSNGLHEVEAKALWKLEMKDEIEDKKPEIVRFAFGGVESFDLNESGTVEYERFLGAKLNVTDANSDGIAEEVEASVLFYHTYDIGDDGSREYQGVARIHVKVVDANSDGHNESAAVQFLAYEALDMNLDGNPEAARGLYFEMSATDANSNGIPEAICLEAAAGAVLDPDSDGHANAGQAEGLEVMVTDATDDGHPELENVTYVSCTAADANEEG